MARTTPLAHTRNVGIVAHVDAGKTTTTERILYHAGRTHRMGEVHAGAAVTDFLQQERDRGITIQSAAVSVDWRPRQWSGAGEGAMHRFNVIDTPGHLDFTIEVNRSLRVLDGAVVVLDAVAGVEPQTETNWSLADAYRVPRIVYVNKMDRPGADFARCVSMVRDVLGAVPLACQVPVGEGASFVGMVDLVSMVALVKGDDGKDTPFRRFPLGDPPAVAALLAAWPQAAGCLPLAAAARLALVEAAVSCDAAALEAYVSDFADPGEESLRACIRTGTLDGSFVPVLCGSSFRNRGVQQVLDAVADYLPSPADVSGIQTVDADGNPDGGRMEPSDDAPFAALAFKGVDDRFGALTFARIYSGTVRPGDPVLNSTRGERLRIGRFGEMQADEMLPLEEARAGQIVAFVSLGETRTGDTLCSAASPVVLERMRFPDPVVSASVEPTVKADQDRLVAALVRMARMDPSLRFVQDAETGECVLHGMGELHLDVTVDRMRTEHGVAARLGEPQVAFRETISETVEHVHVHRKQTGGSGQFAKVRIRFEPGAPGSGFVFDDALAGGSIPRAYVPAIAKALAEQKETGVIGGFPTVDFRATLLDGEAHAVDSNALTFAIAARACFREAMALASPVLLEPVMRVVTLCPDDSVGGVMGEIVRPQGQPRRAEAPGFPGSPGVGHAARRHLRLRGGAEVHVLGQGVGLPCCPCGMPRPRDGERPPPGRRQAEGRGAGVPPPVLATRPACPGSRDGAGFAMAATGMGHGRPAMGSSGRAGTPDPGKERPRPVT